MYDNKYAGLVNAALDATLPCFNVSYSGTSQALFCFCILLLQLVGRTASMLNYNYHCRCVNLGNLNLKGN